MSSLSADPEEAKSEVGSDHVENSICHLLCSSNENSPDEFGDKYMPSPDKDHKSKHEDNVASDSCEEPSSSTDTCETKCSLHSITYALNRKETVLTRVVKVLKTYTLDVEHLLTPCADVNSVNWDFETPLHMACKHQDAELVRILLDNQARVDLVTTDGFTPLHVLCSSTEFVVKCQAVEVATMLLSKNCSVNAQDNLGRTCLHHLSDMAGNNSQHFELFTKLLPLVDVTLKDKLGRTIFHYCSMRGNYRYLEAICIRQIDHDTINEKDIFGKTALHFAFDGILPRDFVLQVISLLLSCGALPNIRNNKGMTPLHLAVTLNDIQVLILLLRKGSNPNIQDEFGATPLHYAVYARCGTEVLNTLMKFKGNVFMKDKLKRTVPQYATYLGHYRMLQEIQSPGMTDSASHASHNTKATEIGNVTRIFSERDRVKSEAINIVKAMMDSVAAIDKRFTCEPTLSGSVLEGTKCGDPDEFDFMCRLIYFEYLYQAHCLRYGQACLRVRKPLPKSVVFFLEFLDSEFNLIIPRVMTVFRKLIERAICKKSFWCPEVNFEFLECSQSGPSICLRLRWIYEHNKSLPISIDIVPTLRIRNCGFEENDIPHATAASIRAFQLHLVMPEYTTYLRVSMSHVEARIMHLIPEKLKLGYIYAKLIRNILIDKNLLHSFPFTTFPGYKRSSFNHMLAEEIPWTYRFATRPVAANKVVKTYVLKMAFFHVLRIHRILCFEPDIVICPNRKVVRENEPDFWCKAIYEFIVSNGYSVPSIFFPDCLMPSNSDKCRQILSFLH